MKKIVSFMAAACLALASFAPDAQADTGSVGVGVKAGTLGIGGEVTVGIIPDFNIRSGYNAFNYNGSITKNNNPYEYTLKLSSFPLLVDWHPFDGSGFRMSAGVLFNNNKVDASGKLNTTVTFKIGDKEYTASDLGTLAGGVTFNSTAPFAGIGWGNAAGAKDGGLSFALDLGVVFQGSPKVALNATGPVASTPEFKAELDKEISRLESDIKNLQYYPVASLGIAYSF